MARNTPCLNKSRIHTSLMQMMPQKENIGKSCRSKDVPGKYTARIHAEGYVSIVGCNLFVVR